MQQKYCLSILNYHWWYEYSSTTSMKVQHLIFLIKHYKQGYIIYNQLMTFACEIFLVNNHDLSLVEQVHNFVDCRCTMHQSGHVRTTATAGSQNLSELQIFLNFSCNRLLHSAQSVTSDCMRSSERFCDPAAPMQHTMCMHCTF